MSKKLTNGKTKSFERREFWNDRNKYSGSTLRELRAIRGVGPVRKIKKATKSIVPLVPYKSKRGIMAKLRNTFSNTVKLFSPAKQKAKLY